MAGTRGLRRAKVDYQELQSDEDLLQAHDVSGVVHRPANKSRQPLKQRDDNKPRSTASVPTDSGASKEAPTSRGKASVGPRAKAKAATDVENILPGSENSRPKAAPPDEKQLIVQQKKRKAAAGEPAADNVNITQTPSKKGPAGNSASRTPAGNKPSSKRQKCTPAKDTSLTQLPQPSVRQPTASQPSAGPEGKAANSKPNKPQGGQPAQPAGTSKQLGGKSKGKASQQPESDLSPKQAKGRKSNTVHFSSPAPAEPSQQPQDMHTARRAANKPATPAAGPSNSAILELQAKYSALTDECSRLKDTKLDELRQLMAEQAEQHRKDEADLLALLEHWKREAEQSKNLLRAYQHGKAQVQLDELKAEKRALEKQVVQLQQESTKEKERWWVERQQLITEKLSQQAAMQAEIIKLQTSQSQAAIEAPARGPSQQTDLTQEPTQEIGLTQEGPTRLELQQEVTRLQGMSDYLAGEAERLRQAVQVEQDRVIELQQGLQVEQDRVIELQQGLQVEQDRVIELQQGLQVEQDRVMELQQGLQVQQGRVMELQQGLNMLQDENNQLTAELEQTRQVLKAEQDHLIRERACNSELQQELTVLQNQNSHLGQEVERLQQAVNTEQMNLSGERAGRSVLQQRILKLQVENDRLQYEAGRLAAEAEQWRHLATAKAVRPRTRNFCVQVNRDLPKLLCSVEVQCSIMPPNLPAPTVGVLHPTPAPPYSRGTTPDPGPSPAPSSRHLSPSRLVFSPPGGAMADTAMQCSHRVADSELQHSGVLEPSPCQPSNMELALVLPSVDPSINPMDDASDQAAHQEDIKLKYDVTHFDCGDFRVMELESGFCSMFKPVLFPGAQFVQCRLVSSGTRSTLPVQLKDGALIEWQGMPAFMSFLDKLLVTAPSGCTDNEMQA